MKTNSDFASLKAYILGLRSYLLQNDRRFCMVQLIVNKKVG